MRIGERNLTDEQIRLEELKDTYFGYVNSNTGMWCGIWGLMAVVFGIALIFSPPEEETLVAGIVSILIGISLIFCCIGWCIRSAFVAAKYYEKFPRFKREEASTNHQEVKP